MSIKQVALKLHQLSVPQKIERSRFIVTSMTGNANFTTPSPALASITTLIDELEAAHMTALGGGTDDTANMHAKEVVLDLSLKLLASYVEGIANTDSITAEAVILSAGMPVRKSPTHLAKEFDVVLTGNPGEVKISTKYKANATFIWQMTLDPTLEKNWEQITQTTQSKIIKSGLVSGTRYYFRVCYVDRAGIQPWSNVLNIIAP